MDFGGGRLHHSWWPHNDDRFNTPEFKTALQEFMDEMRTLGPLKNDAAMRRWCCRYPAGEIGRENFGFVAETENYRFCLRCSTLSGDNSYLYYYDLNQQRMAMAEKEQQYGLTESGLQKLKDTADPSFPHSYDWYAAADSLAGHRNYYSTSDVPASDRREFERLFGRYADYNAEDVVKITYGRNTIYEAATAQSEDMAEDMRIGGINFG